MKRIVILILTLTAFVKVCNSQLKYKMFVGSGNSGQFRLNIIPIAYDSTVSDSKILQYADSLPGGLFHAKTYHLLFKDDSTRLAIQVSEGDYLFHTRFTITEYWKNGNVKRITYFNKSLRRYWEFKYYVDASPQSKGSFWRLTLNKSESQKYYWDFKKGTWFYYNSEGYLMKKEKYDKNGNLKSSNDYNPAKKTATTIFNPKHPKGQPYMIQ